MPQNVWSDVHFFHEGDDFYASVLTDLRQAQRLVQIETYIFDTSPLTQMLLDEMGEARKRGVEVFLVVDGFGSLGSLDFVSEQCLQKGINLKIYKPLFRSWSWFFRLWTPNLNRFGAVVRNLHRRNHRKVILIDSEIAYVGSFNLAAVHSEKLSKEAAWRDSGVRLRGNEIATLEESFHEVWASAEQGLLVPLKRLPTQLFARYLPYNPSHSLFRINFQPVHRHWLYRDLMHKIRRSHFQVQIVTAYFLPRRSLVVALERATKRGVRVDIIIPKITDVPIVKLAARGLVERLVRSGVHVFEYQRRVLHAKYTLIDDWASVGSVNYNHRSFLHDLEVEAVFQNPEDVHNLRLQFVRDLQNSRPWEERAHRAGRIQRLIDGLAFRLRYLL